MLHTTTTNYYRTYLDTLKYLQSYISETSINSNALHNIICIKQCYRHYKRIPVAVGVRAEMLNKNPSNVGLQ